MKKKSMSCFHFSYPDKKGGSFKHRFSWNFFSHGSSAASIEAHKVSVSSSSRTRPQIVSDPNPQITSAEEPSSISQDPSQRLPEPRIFTYAELRAATRNFSRVNLLGEGGFGCVYKGILKHRNSKEVDQEIAVKQLNRKGQQGHKEWLAEVRYLGLVEHPNLVKLVGYCAEDDERGIQRLLVYEFMPNKSLEDHLFQKAPMVQSVLLWNQRLSIMFGAAQGLAYLHEEIEDMQVIFRDFKTSNVLLDKDFNPKLSDFGLARQGPELGATHVSTAVVGTLGYAAPEYVQTGHLTSKSDVWSFGVVLLEILTGRRSLDRNRPKNEQQLLDWVKPYINGSKKLHVIMDPLLEGKYSLLQAKKIANLALQCLGKHARSRPLMSTVVASFKEIVELTVVGSNLPAELGNDRSSSIETSSTSTLSKGLESAKRRKLLLKGVMNLQSKDDARNMWKVWTPKPVEA